MRFQEGEKFIFKQDPGRGTTVWAWFTVDLAGTRYFNWETHQLVPDEFRMQNREQEAAWSPNDKRAGHYQKFASVPHQLLFNWCNEFGVSNIHEDEDVKRKIMQRLDSNEYRDLRTGGGRLV